MLAHNGSNPFVARFTPPSSVTSHNKSKRPPTSRQSSALDIPVASSSLGRHGHTLPLSPADTASPYLAASAGSRPAEPAPLSLDTTTIVASTETAQHVATPLSKVALQGLEKTQTINTSMLARDHLPKIMLGNGSLATRHIMSCLAQTIPGFSRIAPHKARKMLVDALETRMVPLGDGMVEFRKTGRGRWDAHIVGDASGKHAAFHKVGDRHSQSDSDVDSCALSRPGSEVPQSPGARKRDMWASISMRSHEEAVDDMSMDDGASSGDETEAEDWFSNGPQAMQTSLPTSSGTALARINYNAIAIPGSVYRRRFSSSTSRSRRPSRPALMTSIAAQQALPASGAKTQHIRAAHSPQEREAIEALLQMGSM